MRTFLTARGVPLSTSAVSIHHFSATFAGPLLEGSNTDDSFWGDSSVTTTLAGLAGDDIYHIYGTSNRIVEGAAASTDTVTTWMSRSEEHTSELQSLMRISYAVFSLQKKQKRN